MSSDNALDSPAVARARTLFVDSFGDQKIEAAVAGPGRINIIGEHTDYNDGFVFPLALQRSTYMVGSLMPSGATKCRVAAEKFPGEIAEFDTADTEPEPSLPKWARYIKGMCAVYTRKGYSVPLFQAVVVSDVPMGGGLSSSASLEMATGMLIEALGSFDVDPSERALMGQTCEHEFAGVPCGIMDQLISSRGKVGHALLIDCRTLECTPVPLDDPEVVIFVANSNVEHELSGSEYPTRRKQCADAAMKIKEAFPSEKITHLRDCTLEQLEAVKPKLDEDTYKRATHAISEDARTHKAKAALGAGDMKVAGSLMVQSHESLRDLFEVSTPEIDALVEIALKVDGVYGSRITGGGFGGCTVTLVRKDAEAALAEAIEQQYPSHSGGKKASCFSTTAGPGARNLTALL